MKSRRARPKRYHHGDLRVALLASARELLKEKGVENMTLREVARRAGVSHGAPARHFSGLGELLTEIAAETFEELVDSMDEATARPTTKDALEGAGLGYIAFAIQNPEFFRLMFRMELLDLSSPRLQAAKRASLNRIFEALSAAYAREHKAPIEPGKLTARVTLAWSSVHGYSTIWVDEKSVKGVLTDPQTMLDTLRPALLAL